MGGQSSYQKVGTNYNKINGSKGHILAEVTINDTVEIVLISAGSAAVVDYIDVYTETGAITVYLTDGSGKKRMLKSGIPGKILYPGRYGLDINSITISAVGVTVGVDGPAGDIQILSSDEVDQTPNIP